MKSRHVTRADEPLVRRDVPVLDLRDVGRVVARYRRDIWLRHACTLPGLADLGTEETRSREKARLAMPDTPLHRAPTEMQTWEIIAAYRHA